MSGGFCEPRHKNGSREHRAALCHSFYYVKLSDITTTTHGILQQAFGDDAMSRTQAFSLAQNVL
jgi:hypothetical protein